MNGFNFLWVKFPGRPSLVAPHYPPNKNTKWYKGSELRDTSLLVGRVDTLDAIMNSLRANDLTLPKLIALTGIGGIGYCHFSPISTFHVYF